MDRDLAANATQAANELQRPPQASTPYRHSAQRLASKEWKDMRFFGGSAESNVIDEPTL